MVASSKFRFLWLAGGLIAVALGMIGVILPLLPTVPFMLLAAFCFARSSPRLHTWLLNHKSLGPPIKAWQENGAISPKSKIMALICIAAAPIITLLLDVPLWVLGLQIVVLSAVTLFIMTRPNA